MTSTARQVFKGGLAAFEQATQETAVIANSSGGAILRRGLAVAIFSLLEEFLLSRLNEIAVVINQGHLHFSNLPSPMQNRAIKNVIEVANARLSRGGPLLDTSLAQSVGASLTAINGPVILSPLTWAWKGSNLNEQDYFGILKSFHLQNAPAEVQDLAGRLGFNVTSPTGTLLDARDQLKQFASERHAAAHDAQHPVSTLWLNGVLDLAIKYAVCFDAFVSTAAGAMKAGDTNFLNNPGWSKSANVSIRKIVERTKDWAEFREGATKAAHVSADRAGLTLAASSRCGPAELLVVSSKAGRILDWSVPKVS